MALQMEEIGLRKQFAPVQEYSIKIVNLVAKLLVSCDFNSGCLDMMRSGGIKCRIQVLM